MYIYNFYNNLIESQLLFIIFYVEYSIQNILPQEKEFYCAKAKNSKIKIQESKKNQNIIEDLSRIKYKKKKTKIPTKNATKNT